MDLAALIIPVEVNAKVALSRPIMGDGIMIFEDSHEVLHMLFAYIFDSKVFNTKHEAHCASGVCPEPGDKRTLTVSFRV